MTQHECPPPDEPLERLIDRALVATRTRHSVAAQRDELRQVIGEAIVLGRLRERREIGAQRADQRA